jgi:hypothetical protein|nr:MAG TPA: hypothetical protein [Caudoviricetes sp.]
MATKKFSQMTTKKLNALLATASDEDKKAIEAVLAAREQAQAPAAPETTAEETPAAPASEEETQLSPEEEAAIKAAEENGGLNPLYNGSKATQEKKPKMTDEDRHALAEELKKNVNHRCQAVPFNTAEWVDGYIAGVIEEKRSNKVLYAIKTDDGRRIVKVHDSNLVRILDEVVEPEKKARARKAKDPADKIEWTPEAIAEEVNEVIGNIGKTVEFEKYRTTDENGEEHIEMVIGRIVAIVPDKRAQRLLYRISVPAPIEGNPLATKTMHKVVKAEGIKIAEEFDEEGAQLNAKYLERREAAATRTPLTPQDRVIRCEENVKKAEEKLQKAQEELEAKKKQLEDAKKELDEYLAGQVNGETAEAPAETTAEEESLA